MVKTKSYEINMTYGNLFKKIFYFAVPLMLTGVLQILYNAVDMIVVGRFAGPEALSAVGSTNALVNMIINIFIGLSVGVGVCVSRYYGAQNEENINKTVHTAIAVAIIGGILIAIVAFYIVEPLLILMQTPTDVIDGAVIYMKIFFLGMPFNLIYNFGSSVLRAVGDTKNPLKFLAKAGIVNIILNLILVIIFNMSVAGVAIATITAQAVSAFMVLRLLMRSQGALKLELNKIKVHKRPFINILKIGVPAGIQSSLFSISNVVVQSSINSFNSTIITAGNAASSSLEGFLFVTVNSVTQSAITSSGQNMGARKYSRVKVSAYISLVMSIIVSLAMGFIFYMFADTFVALYDNSSADVVLIGAERLKFLCIFYSLCGLMDVIVGQLKGMGYNIFPTVVSFCGVCLFRIAWLATIFPSHKSLLTIYYVYPISWALTTFFLLCILFFAIKRLPKEAELQSENSL